MEFLGIGAGEVILILILGLIVWGPGKVVEIGRTLGRTVRAVKKATSDLTVQVNRELEEEKKKFREESQKNI
ncbi:MAG: hypothetical protein A2Z02_00915 [Chloroflexi bacterium RBG_16_48_7]|nr:MAG: hypothetical protein A2Z02_00915 [Chloroflexi bacterium RBG_16_48_7]